MMTSIWQLSKDARKPRHYAFALLRADEAEAARLWADAPTAWREHISTLYTLFLEAQKRRDTPHARA